MARGNQIDPDDPKVRWAVLGRQAEDFLKSDVGDYLLKQARIEETDALEALRTVSPWRRRRIQQLQNKAKVAGDVQAWLADMITAGHAAMEQIREELS